MPEKVTIYEAAPARRAANCQAFPPQTLAISANDPLALQSVPLERYNFFAIAPKKRDSG